jgi:hypothetical protein
MAAASSVGMLWRRGNYRQLAQRDPTKRPDPAKDEKQNDGMKNIRNFPAQISLTAGF